MARKAGQGEEEEVTQSQEAEREKTPVRHEEKKPACHGGGHHVVEQGTRSTRTPTITPQGPRSTRTTSHHKFLGAPRHLYNTSHTLGPRSTDAIGLGGPRCNQTILDQEDPEVPQTSLDQEIPEAPIIL
ncbi:hypothetical protein STEG23_010165 [Scotinomys teguina]